METIYNKLGNSTRRKISETWTLGDYRVKVTTYHDKAGKAYTSIISECELSESGTTGIYFERHAVHTHLNKLAGRVSVSRYNWCNMERAHNIASDSVRELVDQLLAAHTVAA